MSELLDAIFKGHSLYVRAFYATILLLLLTGAYGAILALADLFLELLPRFSVTFRWPKKARK